MMRPILISGLLGLSLAGCSTSRNVSGAWNCAAGKGSCAPVSAIDEAALDRLNAPAGITPAHPLAAPSGRQPLLAPFASDAPPARTNERVLRIVFPARIDAQGLYHEPSAVHAVVSGPSWAPASTREAPLERQAALPSPPPLPQSPRLATPPEALAAHRDARARGTPVQTPANPRALDAGPERRVGEDLPPFPAPAPGQATAAPVSDLRRSGAGASLLPRTAPDRSAPALTAAPPCHACHPRAPVMQSAAMPLPPSPVSPADRQAAAQESAAATRALNRASMERADRQDVAVAPPPTPTPVVMAPAAMRSDVVATAGIVPTPAPLARALPAPVAAAADEGDGPPLAERPQ